MSFGTPQLLWLLAAVAALAVIDQLRSGVTRRPWPQILRLRAHATHIETAPGTTAPPRRWRLWTGLALLVIAVAAPRAGFVQRPVEPPPREIIVAMDLSRSMLARDVKPSRMDHAKLLAAALVEKTVSDRLGLVLFSSTAYLQLPLSPDYAIVTEMLPHLSPAYFPKSGTNFAAMLTASLGAFSTKDDTERFLIVLSDGEAFGEDWKTSLPELKKRGIRVLTVGIGTKTGDLLLTDAGTLRNTSGAEVVSRLNSATLEELATATGGKFSPGESWVDLRALVVAASPASTKPVTYRTDESQLVERYRWLVLPALLILAWSFWREFPVKPSLRQVRLSAPAALATRFAPSSRAAAATVAIALAALIALPPGLFSQDVDDQRAQMDADPRSPLRALSGLVTQRINGILASPKPNANDCVSLVIDIIAYCDNTHRARQRFPLSIIDDAMLAIEWGERLERDGGAWDKLRGDLRALRKANIEPWKTAKPDAAGVTDMTTGFDPATEMKNDKHSSGLGITSSDTTAADGEEVKGSFADTPAFGDMNADKKAPLEPDEPAPESDQQVVGGKKSSADAERERNPELVLPLQKLEIVRRGDTPAKLFQMLEAKRNEFVPLSPEW